jgi:hypothetical protein
LQGLAETPEAPGYRKALPWLGFAGLALIGLALQLKGIDGAFLSDDFSHLDVIYRFANQGELWSWTVSRFYEPLGNGSFAYRPITFASYVLDWLAHGDSASGWRLTSICIYSINAIVAGAVVSRWLKGRSPHPALGGVVGGVILFAYPFAGEVSFWLAGRFDLLACLFSLLFLLALPLYRRSSPRQHLLRIAFLLAALLSKESALPLPFVATLLVFACTVAGAESGGRRFLRALTTAIAEMWPAWITWCAYLLWRFMLFGTAFNVYPTMPASRNVAEVWQRFSGVWIIARDNVGPHYGAWALLAGFALVAILFSCIRFRRNIAGQSVALMGALLVCAALYAIAPAFTLPVASPDGEGARHLYLAWAYASLLLGMLVAWQRSQWKLGFAFVVVMIAGQAQSLSQWQAAGRQMKDVVAGVDSFAATIRDDQYALLLLPDHIGVALFARTAQDSIVIPPTQRRNYLSRMAVMISTDFAEWSRYISQGKVAELKAIPAFDPAKFAGLYCWNATKSTFVPLTPGVVARDPSVWMATARSNFAQAGCISPF